MAKKVIFTLHDDILAFIDRQAADSENKANRSGYINAVLAAHCCFVLEAETIASLKQDAEDVEDQAEVAACDCVAGDGIDAEGF